MEFSIINDIFLITCTALFKSCLNFYFSKFWLLNISQYLPKVKTLLERLGLCRLFQTLLNTATPLLPHIKISARTVKIKITRYTRVEGCRRAAFIIVIFCYPAFVFMASSLVSLTCTVES
jgi:hypothetical protein